MAGQGFIDPEVGAAMLRADAAQAGPQNLRPVILLAGGGLLIVIALLGGLLMFIASERNPGGITFAPSTVDCSAPGDWTMDVSLPASLKATDKIQFEWGDQRWPAQPLKETDYPGWRSSWNQLSDGSWHGRLVNAERDFRTSCWVDTTIAQPFYYLPMNPGPHDVRVKDASGKIVASGSYTVK